MTIHDEYIWCQGCGIEITWSPVISDNRSYCCEECSRGIQCRCDERMRLDDDYQARSGGTPSSYS